MKESIKVFASATVANVTCGFDVLGFAVSSPGDELVLKPNDLGKVRIVEIKGDGGKLPKDPNMNTASVAINKYLEHLNSDQGFDIYLEKKMPLGSGLGSSAASAVAGVFAANELLGTPLDSTELLSFAMEGERQACGAAHADNVGPALYGGMVLVRSYSPIDVVRIPVPKPLYVSLVHPQISIATKDARDILKKQILMRDAVQQWGNIAGLVVGMMQGDFDLVGRSMQDVIVEPIRSILIPGFDAVKSAALESGAIGCGISGSGPSIFALSAEMSTAEEVGARMSAAFKQINIESEVYISGINIEGPKILD